MPWMIWVNGGVLLTLGSVLPAGILIRELYRGEDSSMLMAYVFTMVCVALELTETLKPRINDVLPFYFLLLPCGVVLSYLDRGYPGAVIYAGITGLAFVAFHYAFRRTGDREKSSAK